MPWWKGSVLADGVSAIWGRIDYLYDTVTRFFHRRSRNDTRAAEPDLGERARTVMASKMVPQSAGRSPNF
jgi:hypothetical protein